MTIADLEVTGSIPEELTGRYLRNGPNPVVAPDPATYHWFLGDGMVHGLRLDGTRPLVPEPLDPHFGVLHDALGEPTPRIDPDFGPNTNVIRRAPSPGRVGPVPYELTDELDTVGPADFDGTSTAPTPPQARSAHPGLRGRLPLGLGGGDGDGRVATAGPVDDREPDGPTCPDRAPVVTTDRLGGGSTLPGRRLPASGRGPRMTRWMRRAS